MKKNVLITGSKGYIGSVLVPVLVKDGYGVRGVDSNFYAGQLLKGPTEMDGLTIEKDIRDIEQQDLQGIDTIIHLAGLSNDPLGEFNTGLTYDINQHAAVRLARLAQQAGVKRFIFASSCSVYGDGGGAFLTEDSIVSPQTAYAHSKFLAEVEIAQLATDDFSPVFVRAGTVYGFSPSMRFDLVVNIFVKNVILKLPLKIFGKGSLWRPLIHIDDVVSSYKVLLEAQKDTIHNKIFNIGSTQENYQVSQIAEKVQKSCPYARIEYIQTDGKDGRDYKVSCAFFENTFPHMRFTSLQEGIQKLYLELIDYSPDLLQNANFVRIASIKDKVSLGVLNNQLQRIVSL